MTEFNKQKYQLIKNYQLHNHDTGSIYLQLVLLNKKIQLLQLHLTTSKKDKHSRYGLFKLISRRRKYLIYLKNTNFILYTKIINEFNFRH